MARNRLLRRLDAALERSRRENPDGPLATYAWMWGALLRSSSNRVGVTLRFASLVAVDASLLVGWALARTVRRVLGGPIRRIGLATAATGVALLLVLGPPGSHPPIPWNGIPALMVEANGLVRFEGQVVDDDEVRALIEHYGIEEASVVVDPRAAVKRVFEITDLLADAGVVFSDVTMDRPS